jgi:hypothetical protein
MSPVESEHFHLQHHLAAKHACVRTKFHIIEDNGNPLLMACCPILGGDNPCLNGTGQLSTVIGATNINF